jgi:hypothetical protein
MGMHVTRSRLAVGSRGATKAVECVSAMMAVALLGGCTSTSGGGGPQATSSVPAPIPRSSGATSPSGIPTGPTAKVLSLKGPITSAKAGGITYLPGGAWAATSLTALRAQIPAAQTKTCSKVCWPDAIESASPAIYIAGPLRTFTCTVLRSVHANFTDATTLVVEPTETNTCRKGFSPTVSGLTLMAVPRSALPNTALLRVIVVNGSARVPPFPAAVRLH